MFAEHRERNDQGWLMYPRDVSFRRSVGFAEESFQHPAKANLHLIQDLVEYLSQPGDRVMDITAGTGSVLVACKLERRAIAIDLNSEYVSWMRKSAQQMLLNPADYIILEGDCRDYLPLPCQAIIFSPPYSQVMGSTGGIMSRDKAMMEQYSRYQSDYSNPKNLGNLPAFRFNYAMRAIYQKCWDSLEPGGHLALLIKDTAAPGRKTNPLGWNHVQMLGQAGWETVEWLQWASPGTLFRAMHQAAGHHTIDSEHIIICRRP